MFDMFEMLAQDIQTLHIMHCTDLPSMETLLCVKLRRIHGLAQNLTKLKQLDVANCYK